MGNEELEATFKIVNRYGITVRSGLEWFEALKIADRLPGPHRVLFEDDEIRPVDERDVL